MIHTVKLILAFGCKQSVIVLSLNLFVGPPSSPRDLNIFGQIIGDATTSNSNSIFLISWSQSNCAVQYVVTIINSSDDRVYPNITTSNTNTTVTLPTGVEFCVTLVAVDSIGRRGPDTTPVCYQCEFKVHILIMYVPYVFVCG